MRADNKRGQAVALFGLAIQAALAGVLCLAWLLTGNDAAKAIFFMLVGALGIWTITAILFYCRHLAELEALELDELARQGSGLFGEQAAEMRLAQRRLGLVNRVFVPLVTLLTALYLVVIGGLLLLDAVTVPIGPGRLADALSWAFVCLGGAFAAFLASRYAIGMARDARWRLLRAGGSYLTVCSLSAALLCLAYFLVRAEYDWFLRLLPYAIPVIMIVLGIEMVLNLVLDLYRPRRPGVEARPAFDSRLANLLSEPGSLAHSIAEALNYQFGFEVSRTWFYQLLQKTLVPLLLFGLSALLAASSLVLVSPGRQAVVLTFGEPSAGENTLAPGLHVKWPWPIQTVDVIDTERIRTLDLGVGGERQASGDVVGGVTVYVWSREHGTRHEWDFLVPRLSVHGPASLAAATTASAPAGGAQEYGAVGAIRIVASLQYRVNRPYRFRYRFQDAEQLLYDIAQRELTHYAAERDVDTLMSARRDEMGRQLHRRIAAAADELDLGVEVATVALQSIHPPTAVADAFEEVIKADHERRGKELNAIRQRQTLLSGTVGSAGLAEELAAVIEKIDAVALPPDQRQAAHERARRLLDDAEGQVSQIIGAARANRWKTANRERGLYLSLQRQLSAHRRAPQVYELNELLKVYRKAMEGSRKYVLGVDPANVEIRQTDDRRSAGAVFSSP